MHVTCVDQTERLRMLEITSWDLDITATLPFAEGKPQVMDNVLNCRHDATCKIAATKGTALSSANI